MPRIHLFEIGDQQWFPTFLRNYMTDFLQFLANKTDLYKGVLPIFTEALQKSNEEQIIDLCSGGGGGLLRISEHLKEFNPNTKIKLSDYYPNIQSFEHICKNSSIFSYVDSPVSALDVPSNLKGFRTMFLSFHHFKPNEAKQILQNAVDSQQHIAIFESQERSVLSILGMILSPISVLLTTPFIKPFSAGRLIFTYLIPIVPICTMWDGIVSSLRTYSVKEMDQLVSSLSNSEMYQWKIGKVKSGPGKILYLIGTRKSL